MDSKDFDREVASLRVEGGAQGVELEEAYRMEIEDALRAVNAPARLDRFGCATNVCVGSIRAPDADWVSRWSGELHSPNRLPMPSMSTRVMKLDEDNYEVRMMFTTRGTAGFHVRFGQPGTRG
ncbi:hypothetical protein [Cognatilysobacter bugurensis]|nr:hypothetical protein [Lysobacter bugurensis]